MESHSDVRDMAIRIKAYFAAVRHAADGDYEAEREADRLFEVITANDLAALDRLAETAPVAIDATWTIGHAADGRYFVHEEWPDGNCGLLRWHDDLLACLDDVRGRIE